MSPPPNRQEARPNFIGIGQPLSGTGWIWKQLDGHRDTRLPPIKEMHFLDHGMATIGPRRNLAKLLEGNAHLQPGGKERLAILKRYFLDPVCEELEAERYRYQESLQAVLADLPNYSTRKIPLTFRPEARHFDWYGGLFADTPDHITGEITPRYCILDRDVIRSLHAWAPEIRIIMAIRHPVDRILSYLQKGIRRGQFSESDLKQPKLVKNLTVDNPIQRPFLSPAANYKNWIDVIGKDKVHLIFLEDIRDYPTESRASVCAFLGLACDPSAFKRVANENEKVSRPKVSVPTAVRDMLNEALEPECQECARVFGGTAKSYVI